MVAEGAASRELLLRGRAWLKQKRARAARLLGRQAAGLSEGEARGR